MHRLPISVIILAPFQGLSLAISHPLKARLTSTANPEYGHWDVTFTSGNAASGYRWENLLATYSVSPETTVTCKQLYDPNVNKTTKTCDDASFSYELVTEWPANWITLWQTVQLEVSGMSTLVTITGKSQIEMECGKGAAGRGCEGSVRVEAVIEGGGESGDVENLEEAR